MKPEHRGRGVSPAATDDASPVRPRRVLILGSGALQIGQAGEFDYSGSQALKALREEGISTVLINPNIATVQTDEGMADAIYFVPVEVPYVEQVIEAEQCDAILLAFGGQTALNTGLALDEQGILRRHGVRVLGTPVSAIRDTEDRELFVRRLAEIGVETARSRAVQTSDDAVRAATEIGFPVMMRSGFALGGRGSSIVHTPEECRALADVALAAAPQILVEECLAGWKEIEYEVVRDGADNCITVCNMENVDPMGIHTGESIVVAPSQTLDDHEYQMLRDVAIRTIRHLGIVGECNIQYALDPSSRQYRVIEVNARLSRSSALASKATGYPLAYVAAKIALGYALPDISNAVTKVTTAFFEPALDYVVCKVPRWDLQKFEHSSKRIGSEMKSVGEVMAIGRSFPEALQKAFRMLEISTDGIFADQVVFEDLERELREPTPSRMFAVTQALEQGTDVEQLHEWTRIDRFFLREIERVVALRRRLRSIGEREGIVGLSTQGLRELKRAGFSDREIARCCGATEEQVRLLRHEYNIRPYLSQIDTLAAEYPAQTNFLYFTYAATEPDMAPSTRPKVLILGSGCYRIGSSVEFDWCAVSAATEARALGYEVIMLNYNPETVSTDYDLCDKLVFDEISLETILELTRIEQPIGVVVSMGGQTPNTLAQPLAAAGVPILGTAPGAIDRAEDRSKFSALLDRLGVDQPRWMAVESADEVGAAVRALGGYPILVRPSYVLSGAAMRVAHSDTELRTYLDRAVRVNASHPVVVSQYLHDAREIELDAVASAGRILVHAVSEHVENAGTHSGDATLVLPPQWLPSEIVGEVERIGALLASALDITGPFNVQALWDGRSVKVIECNLRASRSFPFVSKTLGCNFAREAMRVMLGAEPSVSASVDFRGLQHVAVKAAQFSFGRIKGADPRSGVEMASTGEAASFGATVEDALVTALRATGLRAPRAGAGVLLWEAERRASEPLGLDLQGLRRLGFRLFGNRAAADAAARDGVTLNRVDGEPRHVAALLRSGAIDWVIAPATPNVSGPEDSGFLVRRLAADFGVSLVSERQLARRLVEAVSNRGTDAAQPRSWQAYVGSRRSVVPPLRLFVRQPFTETSAREQAVVQRFLDTVQRLDRPDRPVRILTGAEAQSEATFRQSFERSTGQPFTPRNFRDYRLGLLRQADAMIILRTGLSESTAFELAHNIFEGPGIPVWMAIAAGAPIKTTLLRDLHDLCEISYHMFDDVASLELPLEAFVDALWERRLAERDEDVRKAS